MCSGFRVLSYAVMLNRVSIARCFLVSSGYVGDLFAYFEVSYDCLVDAEVGISIWPCGSVQGDLCFMGFAVRVGYGFFVYRDFSV